jgi:hypothetical protein
VETAAYGLIAGMDPSHLLKQGSDEYLISIAILKKAMEISNERKTEEIKVLAELTGIEVAKVMSRMF